MVEIMNWILDYFPVMLLISTCASFGFLFGDEKGKGHKIFGFEKEKNE